MVSEHERSPEGKTDKLSWMEKEAMGALVRMWEEEEELRGVRCGTAVCELITDLESHGRVKVDNMERDGDAWKVDLEIA